MLCKVKFHPRKQSPWTEKRHVWKPPVRVCSAAATAGTWSPPQQGAARLTGRLSLKGSLGHAELLGKAGVWSRPGPGSGGRWAAPPGGRGGLLEGRRGHLFP